MQIESLAATISPWPERRRRAAELLEARPHASELLRLYLALVDVWSDVHEVAQVERPGAARLAAYAAERVLPRVLEATLAAGPEKLRAEALRRFHEADLPGLVDRWLAGAELSETDRYLARASAAPLLEALPAAARELGAAKSGERQRCPACGGLPQLAYFGISGEALVTAPRYLLCSRCSHSWPYPRMVCAGCGNPDTPELPIFADADRFLGLRVDACDDCHRYLVTVDLPKDPTAVPVVDELVALPLDLFARERGFTKITPNLMGI
jgi:formate dehydrogenase accessory protein FdhE